MQSDGPFFSSFIEKFCRHPRGPLAGQAISLMDEQKDVLDGMFALNDEGYWKHREALIMVHRKWAKTLTVSGIGLGVLTTREMGTEVYFTANSRMQAGILKKNVDAFALASKPLRKRVWVFKNKIETPNHSHLMVLGADAHQAHGYNPMLSVCDEFWAFRNADLPEALASGAAARPESMTIYITTPGIIMDSPLGALVERAERGDDSLYTYWPGKSVSHEFDPFDREVWKEYNIGYRYGWIQDSFLQSQAHALSRVEFARLHLGAWLQQSAGWMNMHMWDLLDDVDPLQPATPMILFVDGAWKHDSVAVVGITIEEVPQIYTLKVWEKPVGDDAWRVPYAEIDHLVRELASLYKVREIGADPFFLGQLLQTWFEDGLPVVEVPTNSVPRAVDACKRFIDGVMEHRIRHDRNKTMRRHLANCVPKYDPKGIRVTANRSNPHGKIDSAVAAIFGYDMVTKINAEPQLWMY